MTPTEYICKAIAYTKAQNIANKKLDKNGHPYRGLHVVIGKLNDALRMAYGTPAMTAEQLKALPMQLVNNAIAEGKVVAIPGKLGPTVYLTEDAPEGGRGPSVTTKEQAFKMFGLVPPPVIAPPAQTTRAKRK